MRPANSHWTQRVGAVLEQFSHDVFDTFRWMISVGIARYVAIQTGSDLFMAVSYALTATLFVFLMSVFLLRGNVTLFRSDTKWASAANLALNLAICMAAFLSCLWLIYALTETFVAYQEG